MISKLIIAATLVVAAMAKTAQVTWYESYPRCCKNPNGPNKAECNKYSGCDYQGLFANGQKLSEASVKSTPIISFFDSNNPTQAQWNRLYKNKKIRITKNGKTFDAFIKDTCSDGDVKKGASNCSKNAKGGFLIDIEYHTALKYLGSTGQASGTATFQILN